MTFLGLAFGLTMGGLFLFSKPPSLGLALLFFVVFLLCGIGMDYLIAQQRGS